nr:prickle-like protein 1-A [Aedes albopictus]
MIGECRLPVECVGDVRDSLPAWDRRENFGTRTQIQRYFDVIPSEKVPKIGTQGERFRDKQLVYQLPKQDLALAYCKHVEETNRSSYEDFVAARNEIALDIGYVKDTPAKTQCAGCGDMLNQGEMAVTAPKFRDQILWHPRCFKCTTCDELLVDLTYCVHDDQIYCERHYAELLKPRCNACDERESENPTQSNTRQQRRHKCYPRDIYAVPDLCEGELLLTGIAPEMFSVWEQNWHRHSCRIFGVFVRHGKPPKRETVI